MNVRSKRNRAIRENVKKAGVWVFLVVFVLSIAGVTLVTATAR